uniref:Peptidase S1 domain-containing protein n=1 Tax=Malurus cyaneus samueli TaxID=2593467 RepID=A0A8C5TC39_9PASS
MDQLQTFLLPLLLLLCPPVSTSKEGGGEARPHSRAHPTPYLAFLQGKDDNFCGGFLLAPGWVVTAAHKPLTVILGAQTLQRREESWQTFEVESYHRHPAFTNPKNGNDILLLKLKGNATTNSHVRPISIQKSRVRGGAECSVAGWGYGTATVTFREATVTIITPRDCLSYNPGLPGNVICGHSKTAGVPEKSDTGDPLVCNNKVLGIFSYGQSNWPDFYTHISPFLPWISRVMKSA